MVVATMKVKIALSLRCEMAKFTHIAKLVVRCMRWVDDHLSWFFTNGNKAIRLEAKKRASWSQEDHVI